MTTVIPNVHYRTSDGSDDYVFTFRHVGAGWRIDIVSQPSYDGRPDGSVVTHRLNSGAGWYICWDRVIPTLDAAKGVAALWADATQGYRRTGRFGAPSDRSHVQDRSTTAQVPWASRSGNPGEPSPRQASPTTPRPNSSTPTRTTGLARLRDWLRT